MMGGDGWASLNQGAFGRRELPGAEPIEKSVQLNTKRTFDQGDIEPDDSASRRMEDTSPDEVLAGSAKILLGRALGHERKLP